MISVQRILEKPGQITLTTAEYLGDYFLFLSRFIAHMFSNRFRTGLFFRQMEFVGNRSLSLVVIAGAFVGAVIGLQLGIILRLFNAEGMVGGATGASLSLELAPVICSFIVTGRAGAASAAEIATMRVSEQIDAMESMGVDSLSYLVAPRVLATMVMMPVLYFVFLFLGLLGCFSFAKFFFNIDTAVFLDQLNWIVDMTDITNGLVKSFFFGVIFSTISCYFGFHAKGGAKGVGEATTTSVVASLLTILIFDFIITYIQVT